MIFSQAPQQRARNHHAQKRTTTMATTYDLIDANGTTIRSFARKDTAIKADARDGLGATAVRTSTGTIVFEFPAFMVKAATPPTEENTMTENAATTPAKAPKAKTEKAGFQKAGRPTDIAPVETTRGEDAVQFTLGNAVFAGTMLDGATGLVEARGLEWRKDAKSRALVLSGGDSATRKATVKAVEAAWLNTYTAFRAWKTENKDARREKSQTPDGRKALLIEERAFLADTLAGHAAGQDVL